MYALVAFILSADLLCDRVSSYRSRIAEQLFFLSKLLQCKHITYFTYITYCLYAVYMMHYNIYSILWVYLNFNHPYGVPYNIFMYLNFIAILGLDNVNTAISDLEALRKHANRKTNGMRSAKVAYTRPAPPPHRGRTRLRKPSRIGPEMSQTILEILKSAS